MALARPGREDQDDLGAVLAFCRSFGSKVSSVPGLASTISSPAPMRASPSTTVSQARSRTCWSPTPDLVRGGSRSPALRRPSRGLLANASLREPRSSSGPTTALQHPRTGPRRADCRLRNSEEQPLDTRELALQLELCLPRLVSSPAPGGSIDGLRAFSRNPGRRARAAMVLPSPGRNDAKPARRRRANSCVLGLTSTPT